MVITAKKINRQSTQYIRSWREVLTEFYDNMEKKKNKQPVAEWTD